jgi:hypothetical protein
MSVLSSSKISYRVSTYNNGGSDQTRLHRTAGRGEMLRRLDFIVEALENVCEANLSGHC